MSDPDTIVVIDTETSDLPENGGALMEVGWVACGIVGDDRRWQPVTGDWSFVEFTGVCSVEARATHHIRPEECLPGAPRCLPRDVLMHSLLCAETPATVYCAHNSPFDRQFLGMLGQLSEDQPALPWIDTLQCARHIWPDAPRHTNQVLRYWRDVEPPAELLVDLAPHRALYDAAVTAAILCDMLREHSVAALIRMSSEPILQKICNFGSKHRGTPWAEVPRGYLAWIRDKTDAFQNDPNLAHTVRHYLEA